ncbi:MAG TPA: Asp-tRNA(Asn)/Glu-tRNA(Gln) amidotransferase subunit GatB [Phnomibacter sp.]|nr:Asp-tRNA(Asn)/Glu-tRNA(Gln) amidotransferase subunit GatB [Phnomibacter sp.]
MSIAYETVIGLEVHIQLLTRSKLFCSDATAFGASPNTQVSPISLAHPGTLPMLNQHAVELAIKLGLALNCTISPESHFDRKHYFYPDLPKGYQTSQLTHPILMGGHVHTALRDIPIHHIHLEEDAGKSIHDADDDFSCIDLNRAGMPLLELVTEPAIRSSEEAFAFLTELRKLVRWLQVCDGNMEEGSLRCDANISIRPVGETKLGTKVEIKNLNSIRNVKRAIDAEVLRQTALANNGERIVQETRGYNADTNTTSGQREKEEANDYRYFPCPDLPPFTTNAQQIETIAATMPALPQQLQQQFVTGLALPVQDAEVLTEDKSIADYYLHLLEAKAPAKPAANWMLGPVKNWINDHQKDITQFPVSAAQLAAVIAIVQEGKVNFSMAATKLLPALLQQPTASVSELAASLGIVQQSDAGELETWVMEVLQKMPDKVKEYQKGKKGLIGLFVGEVKKLSKGKADPQVVTKILEAKLKEA